MPASLKRSPEGISKASKLLDLEGKVDEQTQLLPDEVARDVILAWNAEMEVVVSEEQAKTLTRALLAGYHDLKPHDGKGYLDKITRAFQAYPLCVAIRVAQEMPTKQPFAPREAELHLALKAEKDRILVIVGLAMKQRQERRRREEEAAKEASYTKTPEQKKRAIEAWKAARPMEEMP